MKKRRSHKKKMNYKILFIVLIIFLLTLLLFFVFTGNYTTYAVYKMDLYLKKPSGEILKIRECSSDTSNFNCMQPLAECYEPGEYYSRAVTYYGNTILSESGWQLTYTC